MDGQTMKNTEKNTTKLLKLSAQDKKILEEQTKTAGFSDSSSYLRFLIYNTPARHPEIKELLENLVYEVNKVGVNINQITRDYNTTVMTREEKIVLQEKMDDIKYLLFEVRAKLSERI